VNLSHRSRIFSLSVVLLASASVARAQTTEPSATSTSPQTTLLQQISRETQALFEGVRPSLVVVQLPPPRWATALMQQQQHQLLQKWGGQMSPALQKRLQEETQVGRPGNVDATINAAATQPTSAAGAPRLRVVQRPDGGIDLVAGAPGDDKESPQSGPRSLGVILNDEGFVLVPFFIEREDAGDHPMKVYLSPGKTSAATFVGSDQKTNLTLLKLREPAGKPISMLGHRPPAGSMVMVLLTNGEAGQLLIWTGALQDSGAVFGADGSLAGFSRGGQFLSGEQTRPIVDQLMKYGVVRRATLGVTVRMAEGPTGQPALRIDEVRPNTAAAAAGLKAGDMVLTLAGRPVSDPPSFAAAIAASDGPTELEFLREGEPSPQKVTVELRPQ
jgi:hypothetical protein